MRFSRFSELNIPFAAVDETAVELSCGNVLSPPLVVLNVIYVTLVKYAKDRYRQNLAGQNLPGS